MLSQPKLVAGQFNRPGRRAENSYARLFEIARRRRQNPTRLRRDQHGKIGRTRELAKLALVLDSCHAFEVATGQFPRAIAHRVS